MTEMKTNSRSKLVAGVAALLLAIPLLLLLASCGDDSEPAADSEGSSDATAVMDGDDMMDDDHVDGDHEEGEVGHEITVISSDAFSYDPAELTLTAGERVRVTLDNSDAALLHDFTIEGLSADDIHSEGVEHHHDDEMADMSDDHMDDDHMDDMDAEHELHVATEPGGTATLEFTPTEDGEFVFYCTVEGHRDAGMEGTVTVEEA